MERPKFITNIYWILAVSFAFTFLIFILNFFGHTFSSNSSDWGVFGDYIGGVLNPITAAINIVVFIYLTQVISKTDEKAHQRNIEQQQNLTLSQLRHSTYEEITKQLESLIEKIMKANDKAHYQTSIHNLYLKGLFENMSHLFPSLKTPENTTPILTTINKMTIQLEKFNTESNDDEQNKIGAELKILIKQYITDKQVLVKKLQADMLGNEIN